MIIVSMIQCKLNMISDISYSEYPFSILYPLLIMTKSVMLSLLNRCNTGNDMLAVLDTLVEDSTVEYTNSPTLEHIEF